MHAAPSTATLTPRGFRVRVALIGVLALAALVTVAAVPPFPQDPTYHNFADQRPLLGVPHCLNVASNLPFVAVGILGVCWLMRPSVRCTPALFAAPWERWAFLALFAFVGITGFGSAYYHWQPDNSTLYWDRLPLTVVFMTFFGLVVAERINPQLGPWLWPPLVAAGVFGVTYWHWTELQGAGDIRFYALVQFFPLLVNPILLLAFPARYYRTADLFAILGWYALAKLLEHADGIIYGANGAVSGHTLKHLVAALGAFWMVLLLRKRYNAPWPPLLRGTFKAHEETTMTSAATMPPETRALPTHLDLPFEDKSVPHNFFELRQARLLTSAIEYWLHHRRPGFECEIGEDNYIYWDITTPPTLGAKAPDWFLVPGVPPLLDGVVRNSYVMWQEKVVPALVAEFVSEEPGGEWDKTPRTGKFWVYEQGIRAPHYIIFDPWHDLLEGYKLVHGSYEEAQPNERGHYPVEALGLEYGLWQGLWQGIDRLWLRFWDSQGQMLLTHAEAGEQAERAKQQAYAKLRELGIDPEKLG